MRAHRIGIDAPVAAPAAVSAEPALTLPDKLSIAVLPFANMSGDPEQEYFADGMVEDIACGQVNPMDYMANFGLPAVSLTTMQSIMAAEFAARPSDAAGTVCDNLLRDTTIAATRGRHSKPTSPKPTAPRLIAGHVRPEPDQRDAEQRPGRTRGEILKSRMPARLHDLAELQQSA